MTIRSASAIAASASSEARTSSGVIHTRSMPAVRMIRDWPSTVTPSPTLRVERQRASPYRHDLAAHGQDPVDPADALLEVAALDGGHRRDQQVADGVTGQARTLGAVPGRPSAAGKRYWSSSLMSGSASASAAMQLRMSPTGGMPSSWRRTPDEPPSSATVTTAVRLLVCSLRPRSSVDRPGPAADRHDPRSPRQEPLLVDDLDERLVGVGRAERIGHDADDPVGARARRARPRRPRR